MTIAAAMRKMAAFRSEGSAVPYMFLILPSPGALRGRSDLFHRGRSTISCGSRTVHTGCRTRCVDVDRHITETVSGELAEHVRDDRGDALLLLMGQIEGVQDPIDSPGQLLSLSLHQVHLPLFDTGFQRRSGVPGKLVFCFLQELQPDVDTRGVGGLIDGTLDPYTVFMVGDSLYEGVACEVDFSGIEAPWVLFCGY